MCTHTQNNFLNVHTGTLAPPYRNARKEEGILSARKTPMGKSFEKIGTVVQKKLDKKVEKKKKIDKKSKNQKINRKIGKKIEKKKE